jgi:hypothetical protein
MEAQMARTTTLGLVLAGASVFATVPTQDSKNGIYALAKLAGDKIELGDRLTTHLGSATIAATTNDNSRFRVQLAEAGPFPKGWDQKRLVLHAGGISLLVAGWSQPTDERKMTISAQLEGLDAARRVAAALGTKLHLREHPGHRFLVRVTPKQRQFTVGEPVTLKLEIENVGTAPFSFMDGGMQRGARNNQFSFIAASGQGSGPAVPDTGDPMNFGGIAVKRTLEPGQRFAKEIGIDKWFRFTKPDTYRITALFRMHVDTAGSKLGWDDFAVGECLVRISGRR